jgi:hypothetical protein
MAVRSIVLSQYQKKYLEDDDNTESIIAIADDNDLQLIEDVVRPSQTLNLC